MVYQAFQESTKRKVAIKVMKEGPFAGTAAKARFEREVQILGQLKHPNIVTVYDSGTAAGSFFFVMDYISGQPLDVYMGSKEHSIDDTLKLFAKICDANPNIDETVRRVALNLLLRTYPKTAVAPVFNRRKTQVTNLCHSFGIGS